MVRTLSLSLLVSACVSSANVTTVHRSYRARVRASCAARDDALVCAKQQTSWSDLGIAMPLRSIAQRELGGLFVVDANGVLYRLDARGTITGHHAHVADQVLLSEGLVCVREPQGALLCAVDRHDDRGCSVDDLLTDLVSVGKAEAPLVEVAPKLFCDAQERCLRLMRPCQTACLRFPTCHAALRCVDACPAGQPAVTAQHVAGASIFSRGSFIIQRPSSDS